MSVYRCDKKKHQKQKKKNVPMVRPNCTTFILIEKYRAPAKISMKAVKQTVNNFFFFLRNGSQEKKVGSRYAKSTFDNVI